MTSFPRLTPGDTAPAFTLTDQSGAAVSLSDFSGENLIVYFYPAAMTPGCTTQACDFRDNLAFLQAAGYRVVGVSNDDPDTLAAFAERDALTFPLLSDSDLAVHKAYGAYGEKNSYGRVLTGRLRSTIVLNGSGTVQLARYNVKATGHVGMLRRALGIDA